MWIAVCAMQSNAVPVVSSMGDFNDWYALLLSFYRFSQEICRQGEYLVNSFVKALNALELEDKVGFVRCRWLPLMIMGM